MQKCINYTTKKFLNCHHTSNCAYKNDGSVTLFHVSDATLEQFQSYCSFQHNVIKKENSNFERKQ